MDEVDGAFILHASSPRPYKRWSSAVNASSEIKGFDEVDASIPLLADRSSGVTLPSAAVTEDKGPDLHDYELVTPAELALQLRAGLDKVHLELL